jgi:hypothetical protein
VVRFEIGIALSTNIEPKVKPVLAVGRLQGQSGIGLERLDISKPMVRSTRI